VDKLNECAIDMFTGDTITILSADNIKIQDSPGEAELYPVEYLNTITPSGFPSHELKLKIGCPVILLRNIDVSEGLCNGTRLIVKRISRNQKLLICIFASGVRKNEEVVIPRMNLDTEENLLPFIMTRRQFPIRLAFAMTINKAQGQTLKKVGIYLNAPVFSHGQLYVALSRTGDKSSVKIFMNEIKNRQGKIENRVGWFTDNIVYGEALSN
jgi:ATP-dependent DNA helicase PIF1